MTIATSDQLLEYGALRRQLRDIKGLVEKRTGVFEAQGKPLVELHADGTAIVAVVRSRHGETRYALGTPVDQRKLIDEAKRRVLKLDDD